MKCHCYRPFDPDAARMNVCGFCGELEDYHAKTIIVTGGRAGVPDERVWEALDAIQPKPRLIVQGGAQGVDWAAEKWAKRHGIPCATHVAQWNTYGARAGPVRNQQMLEGHPDAVVYAFPGPASKGTRDCIAQAKKLGMPVRVFEP